MGALRDGRPGSEMTGRNNKSIVAKYPRGSLLIIAWSGTHGGQVKEMKGKDKLSGTLKLGCASRMVPGDGNKPRSREKQYNSRKQAQ